MMPAMRAVADTSPFGTARSEIARNVVSRHLDYSLSDRLTHGDRLLPDIDHARTALFHRDG